MFNSVVNTLLEMLTIFAKNVILNIWQGSEYASAWVRQFWINEISKIYHEETQKNGYKYIVFVPGNSCSKIFDFG